MKTKNRILRPLTAFVLLLSLTTAGRPAQAGIGIATGGVPLIVLGIVFLGASGFGMGVEFYNAGQEAKRCKIATNALKKQEDPKDPDFGALEPHQVSYLKSVRFHNCSYAERIATTFLGILPFAGGAVLLDGGETSMLRFSQVDTNLVRPEHLESAEEFNSQVPELNAIAATIAKKTLKRYEEQSLSGQGMSEEELRDRIDASWDRYLESGLLLPGTVEFVRKIRVSEAPI